MRSQKSKESQKSQKSQKSHNGSGKMGNEYAKLKKQRCLQLVQECAHSGKSKREWCAENGIGYSTFMRWQKRLRNELAGELLAPQEIVPVQVELPEQSSRWNTGTALAKAEPADCEEGIEIRTGNIRIRLPGNTPAGYLASLVKELV